MPEFTRIVPPGLPASTASTPPVQGPRQLDQDRLRPALVQLDRPKTQEPQLQLPARPARQHRRMPATPGPPARPARPSTAA
jgi:hypothetical protein